MHGKVEARTRSSGEADCCRTDGVRSHLACLSGFHMAITEARLRLQTTLSLDGARVCYN